jgi:hypothetical protein
MENNLVVIHMRYAPNGTVIEISERPAGESAQDWFNRLSEYPSNGYQPLSGGRAVFRISRAEIDSLKGAAETKVEG